MTKFVDWGVFSMAERPRFLPRYIITGSESDEFVNSHAKWMVWKYPKNPVWLLKIRLHRDDSKPVIFAIGTPRIKCVGGWYYVDTGGAFPAIPGAVGEVKDSMGRRGMIELVADPIPAPWWET